MAQNYYKRMKEIYDELTTMFGTKQIKKIVFLNNFIKQEGLNIGTGRRKFEEAVDIGVIRFVGVDENGCDLIEVTY